MPRTAASAPRRRPGRSRAAAANPKGVATTVKSVAKPDHATLSTRLVRKAAGKAVRAVAGRTATAGADVIRTAAQGVAAAGERGLKEWMLERRLPIQLSIDVAVPVSVAWEEWLTL